VIASTALIEEEFRRAVERRDLAAVTVAVSTYSSAVFSETALLPQGSNQRILLVRRAFALFEWADNVLRAHRSLVEHELQTTRKAAGLLNAMQRAHGPHLLLDERG
jgi:hypothetical protein